MELGAFSVSLAVKDIEASKPFYEKLGFTVFGGDQSQNWITFSPSTRAGVPMLNNYGISRTFENCSASSKIVA